MSRYTVELTEAVLSAIAEQARYIAVEAKAPMNAQRWLERIWDAVDSLERWPCRAALADESSYVDYDVRQLIVGKQLILFTVHEEQRRIWIIGLRHGHRRPRPGDLPADEAEPGTVSS